MVIAVDQLRRRCTFRDVHFHSCPSDTSIQRTQHLLSRPGTFRYEIDIVGICLNLDRRTAKRVASSIPKSNPDPGTLRSVVKTRPAVGPLICFHTTAADNSFSWTIWGQACVGNGGFHELLMTNTQSPDVARAYDSWKSFEHQHETRDIPYHD
jgi:hypothetical protein